RPCSVLAQIVALLLLGYICCIIVLEESRTITTTTTFTIIQQFLPLVHVSAVTVSVSKRKNSAQLHRTSVVGSRSRSSGPSSGTKNGNGSGSIGRSRRPVEDHEEHDVDSKFEEAGERDQASNNLDHHDPSSTDSDA
ncbi:unnamed protein product, partial [Amoebophrya sp. A120]